MYILKKRRRKGGGKEGRKSHNFIKQNKGGCYWFIFFTEKSIYTCRFFPPTYNSPMSLRKIQMGKIFWISTNDIILQKHITPFVIVLRPPTPYYLARSAIRLTHWLGYSMLRASRCNGKSSRKWYTMATWYIHRILYGSIWPKSSSPNAAGIALEEQTATVGWDSDAC